MTLKMPLYQPIASQVPGAAPPRLHLQPGDSTFSDRPSLASRRSTSTVGTNATSSTSITVPSYAGSAPRSPGLSIAGSFSTQLTSPPLSPSIPPPEMSSSTLQAKPKKKKSSILGSFFAREPSTDAFLQMQQQAQKRIAQDPCRKIPAGMSSVSTAKIPEHVPKVNTRWDGMPGKPKQDNGGMLLRSGSFNRSDSSDLSRRRSYYRPPSSSTSSSNVEDFPLRPSTTSQPSDQFSMTEHDLGTSNKFPSKVRPMSLAVRSASFGSATESNLPHITSFSPDNFSGPSTISNRHGLPPKSSGSSPGPARLESSQNSSIRGMDFASAASAHTALSGLALVDHSPATASCERNTLTHLTLSDQGQRRYGSSREGSAQPISAFLAGEAQPFHLPGENRNLQAPSSAPDSDVAWRESATSNHPRRDLLNQDMALRPNFEKRVSTINPVEVCPWEQDEDAKPP